MRHGTSHRHRRLHRAAGVLAAAGSLSSTPWSSDRCPSFRSCPARAMAKLHGLEVPAELAASHGAGAPIAMWADLASWLEQVCMLRTLAMSLQPFRCQQAEPAPRRR